MINVLLFDKRPHVHTANGRKHCLCHGVARCIHFVESDRVFYFHSVESMGDREPNWLNGIFLVTLLSRGKIKIRHIFLQNLIQVSHIRILKLCTFLLIVKHDEGATLVLLRILSLGLVDETNKSSCIERSPSLWNAFARRGSIPCEIFSLCAHVCPRRESSCLAPVIQRVDNAIHQINLYPVDSAIRFVKSLSAG